LLEQERFLISELLVLFFIVEVAEEGDKLLLVLNQDIKDGFGLVRVGHEHFEDVESLKLNSFVLVPQEVHHQFEVLLIADVLGHDVEIGSVQQQLAKKLERLPSGHIILGV